MEADTPQRQTQRALHVLARAERRVIRAVGAHFMAAGRFERLDRFATTLSVVGGLAVSLLTALPFTASSATAPHRDAISASLFVAGFLLASVSFAQAAGRWAARAERHHQAATGYTAARRRIEALSVPPDIAEGEFLEIIKDLSELARSTDRVPDDIWKRAQNYGRPGLLEHHHP